jgi:hypothetical protein
MDAERCRYAEAADRVGDDARRGLIMVAERRPVFKACTK